MLEDALEGKTLYIIKEGVSEMAKFGSEFAADEFFAELRYQNIEHLGQVKSAILETSGKISLLFYGNDEIKPGLPIWPEQYNKKVEVTELDDLYACSKCGTVKPLTAKSSKKCSTCKNVKWVEAIETLKVQ